MNKSDSESQSLPKEMTIGFDDLILITGASGFIGSRIVEKPRQSRIPKLALLHPTIWKLLQAEGHSTALRGDRTN